MILITLPLTVKAEQSGLKKALLERSTGGTAATPLQQSLGSKTCTGTVKSREGWSAQQFKQNCNCTLGYACAVMERLIALVNLESLVLFPGALTCRQPHQLGHPISHQQR
jgi:hypothetical protein